MTAWKKLLASVLTFLLAPGITACSAHAQDDVRALFINVRKADAALFFLGDARYLVDTGHKDSHEQLMRVLEAFEITRLDGVFVTHTDKDHAGGLKKMLKAGMQVDRLYGGEKHSEKSLEDHPVYEAAEKYGVPVTWLKAGDEVDAGNGNVFRVLGPLSQDPVKENNNSLVMRLTTPHGDMLLTGDMEEPEEAELLQAGLIQSAPVLKVGNHARATPPARPLPWPRVPAGPSSPPIPRMNPIRGMTRPSPSCRRWAQTSPLRRMPRWASWWFSKTARWRTCSRSTGSNT